jgi:putative FmdB family regulatory protein
MPLFEFECRECGTEFERLVRKAGETAELKCPACGGISLEEKISGFASVSRGGASDSSACAPGGG